MTVACRLVTAAAVLLSLATAAQAAGQIIERPERPIRGLFGGGPPPDPDWGGMVKDSYALMSIYPHMSLFPAAAITSLVVGFSLLADGIREISMRD